ncbi:hypothetical protein A0J61_04197 [Choanephora cucurbitarum]|uniref:Uncharacterized protein n=1 Tax=Choanephora cucurbitarum TaxID=101091 RepID=A0A1C7NGU1_9FUNG|nr:hypothetical protein A0J61_04197 [Choanephora cucurbitarum]
MHPIVHSTSSSSHFKSKWILFKNWFAPDMTKRRPSECSTTSTHSCCCCHQQKTSSEDRLMVRCISSFRRRSSNASTETTESNQEQLMQQYHHRIEEEEKKLRQLFSLAEEELYCAKVSYGSAYYMGDRIAAKEAIEDYIQHYRNLLGHLDQSQLNPYISHHEATFRSEASYLKRAYERLPKHNQMDH